MATDNGYHYTSLAIKKELKPGLDRLVELAHFRSFAALVSAMASDPERAVSHLQPFIDAYRDDQRAAQLERARAALESRSASD